MTGNKAFAITSVALLRLHEVFKVAESPEDFLAEADAIIRNPDNQLILRHDLGPAAPLEASPGASGQDVENAPIVYEFLGAIDRANAADPRLWTALAFSTYRDYMERRWPLDAPRVNWKSRVESRWLLRGATRGKLVRHGIARLWWIAFLTHDPKLVRPLSRASDDPFAYTRAVFQREDRVLAIFDRESGAIPSLARAVLEHASHSPQQGVDSHIRSLMREVALVNGFRDLEVLDSEAIREVVDSLAVEDGSRGESEVIA